MGAYILNWIAKKESQEVFDLEDLEPADRSEFKRMEADFIADQMLIKLTDDVYTIPYQTRFGLAGTNEDNLIKYLFKKDPQSYMGSMCAFNQLGLSTQVPAVITIVNNRFEMQKEYAHFRVIFIKTDKTINPEYRTLYPILDAFDPANFHLLHEVETMKDLKKVLKMKIQALSDLEKTAIQEIVKEYPGDTQKLVQSALNY
jgi:hypothetical protein